MDTIEIVLKDKSVNIWTKTWGYSLVSEQDIFSSLLFIFFNNK